MQSEECTEYDVAIPFFFRNYTKLVLKVYEDGKISSKYFPPVGIELRTFAIPV